MKSIALAAALLLLLAPAGNSAAPQSTAFTYQGSLNANGHPANGNFDLTFRLFDAATNGTQVGNPVAMAQFPVVNGKFTTDLDFHTGAFSGNQLWIEVTVGTETLTPRQPVNSVPVAQYALSVPPPPPTPIFMSSTASATLTTNSMGQPNQVAVLPLSGYANTAYAYTLTPGSGNRISLNPTANPPPPGPQLFASSGAVGSMRGMLMLTSAGSGGGPAIYIGTTIAVSAQIYTSSSSQIPGNELAPLPGASCSFDTANMRDIFYAGLYSKCVQTGLSASFLAGDQAVLVLSATATGVGTAPLEVSITMNAAISAGP